MSELFPEVSGQALSLPFLKVVTFIFLLSISPDLNPVSDDNQKKIEL